MGRIIAIDHVTLDGVMQAPGRPDEDTRGGFAHGGWAAPRSDETVGQALGAAMTNVGALLLGRRTYAGFAAFWPHQTDGNPFTDLLNAARKYVASTTLAEPLPWQRSSVLGGDTIAAVRELKAGTTQDLAVFGSGELVGSLRRAGLVDEYVLMIHPLVLGTGRRLFDGDGSDGGGSDGDAAELQLVGDAVTSPSGVVVARYRPATAT